MKGRSSADFVRASLMIDGRMEVEMPANALYYVSFTADPAPSRVDRSNRNPGPSDGKQRAGYTSFVLDAKITVKWEDGPIGTDSLTPFFFESVNIFFLLKDFTVQDLSGLSSRVVPLPSNVRTRARKPRAPSDATVPELSGCHRASIKPYPVTYPTVSTPNWPRPGGCNGGGPHASCCLGGERTQEPISEEPGR